MVGAPRRLVRPHHGAEVAVGGDPAHALGRAHAPGRQAAQHADHDQHAERLDQRGDAELGEEDRHGLHDPAGQLDLPAGHDHGDGHAAQDRQRRHGDRGDQDRAGVGPLDVAGHVGVETADLHAGERDHDAGRVDQAGQAVPGRDDRGGMERDLRAVAGGGPPQAQADDRHGRHRGPDDHPHPGPPGRFQRPEQRGQPSPPRK